MAMRLLSQPKFWIPATRGDIIDQKGYDQHDEGTSADRYQDIKKPQSMDFAAADHRNKGSGTSRRVQGLGEMHHSNGGGHGHGGR